MKQEDLAAEAKSWKARCLEAVEHLERMKHDSQNRKQRQAKLEKQIATLNSEIRELSKVQDQQKINSSHQTATLTQENSELQNQLNAARKTYQLEREKYNDQQTKYKEMELKFDQLKRDMDRSSGKVVDLQEQKKSDEYGWEREKKVRICNYSTPCTTLLAPTCILNSYTPAPLPHPTAHARGQTGDRRGKERHRGQK